MEDTRFCQSCSMPLGPGMHGTEKDGSASEEYCQYCYQNGQFVNPGMSIEEMKTVVKTEMEKRNIAADITENAINILPSLKRWSQRS